jgi:hypothetical protein
MQAGALVIGIDLASEPTGDRGDITDGDARSQALDLLGPASSQSIVVNNAGTFFKRA